MASNDKEFTTASKYDIYSRLMLIASKYFDVTTEDFLKTGLFGYITESMAMIARDSSFHKSMVYNESFLNTAVMPKSIYNWAKMFGVSVPAATPAYADIQVTIPVEALIFTEVDPLDASLAKYGADVTTALNGKQLMVLDRGNQFVAGEFRFTLERSVLIYKGSEEDTVLTVKYCATEEPATILQNLDNFFIKNIVKDNYISFVVRAYQYDVESNEEQIASASFLDTKIHEFEFNNQFVGARLKYRKNGVDTPIELRFSTISSPQDTSSRFAYYSLIDSNKVQVRFSSSAGDFVPASNSTLLMDIYTTRGASGNITYTGDVIFRFSEESLKSIPVLAIFFNDSSIGGVDSPSLSKLKSTIINEISTRDVIVTETDLNNYFAILTSLLETINDGRVVFVKRRDDILRRVFSAYILMRDGLDINGAPAESNYTSKVIPTNTLTADFAISSNLSRPFGTVIRRKSGDSGEYEYVPASALNGSDDYYIVPFFMRVNLDPFRKVKYIYNLADDSTSLSYRDATGASPDYYIIPSSISVKRVLEGTNASPYYVFTASMVTDFNMEDEITPGNSSFSLSFYSNNNSLTPIGGASLSFTEGSNMRITSAADTEQDRFITTMEFFVDVNNDGTEFDFSAEEATNNYGTFVKVSKGDAEVSLPEEVRVQLDFNNVIGGEVNLSFISDKSLLLFRNLDELMFSDIELNKIDPRWNALSGRVYVGTSGTSVPGSGTGANGDFFMKTDTLVVYTKSSGSWGIYNASNLVFGDLFFSTTNNGVYRRGSSTWSLAATSAAQITAPSVAGSDGALYVYNNSGSYTIYEYDANTYVSSVRIKDIPVVHQSFFTSEANQTKFIRQLFVYIDALRDNLGKLETNTFFDLKFYNTFGDSQYYNTPRTDLNLELDVYVFERTDDLANAIRDYVRLLVDNANRGSALRISTLIKDLTTNFSRYIDHVDFKGLNGTFTQFVNEISTVSKNLYAPEYLNVSEENLASINVIQLAE